MAENGIHELRRVHDTRVAGACPTCDGPLDTRTGPRGVWAWCGACCRLSHPVVLAGPAGPVFMHPAAAA
jgi:hypothetical protein